MVQITPSLRAKHLISQSQTLAQALHRQTISPPPRKPLAASYPFSRRRHDTE
jgi:hypothetical protein